VRLTLGGAHLAAIGAAAEAAWPEECCGLLIGRETAAGWEVEETIAAANVAPDPVRRFEVEPGTLLEVHRRAREAGRALIGHYHSHPGGPARPSDHDRARAREAGAEGEVWVIVPVTAKGAGAPAAFLFDGAGFKALETAPRP
jgi:proteasome lid subunit RPN8/RPN11